MKRNYRVAVIHYHLRPGGVTRVIESASQVLGDRGFTQGVLSGEAYKGSEIARTEVVSRLGYDERSHGEEEDLLRELRSVATTVLGGPPDIWHFHNHSLGKNPQVSALPGMLAEMGEKVLLQIHDFAENGRPRNYPVIAGINNLYPQGAGVGYAVLTGLDRSVLCDAGFDKDRVSVVGNPVTAPVRSGLVSGGEVSRKLLFYPTRAIRRKNIGEAILLSLALPENWLLATSRAPKNPQWSGTYECWEDLAAELNVPIAMAVVGRMSPLELAVGDEPLNDFTSWYGAASAILTTSVSEGFGLAFLEPLLAGLPVIGRDLPSVTAEMGKNGVWYKYLYSGIQLPLEWLPEEHLRLQLEKSMSGLYLAYQCAQPVKAVEEAFGAIVNRGTVDFGNLLESDQANVIRRVMEMPDDLAKLRICMPGSLVDETLTDWMARSLAAPPENQSDAVREGYGLEGFGEKMARCYQNLLEAPVQPARSEPEIARAILKQFLCPRDFQFLLS